jgi:hypothetical protein
MSDLTIWLSRITGGATPREVAKRIPYSYSTVARWLRADDIPCEAIVRIATEYEANVLEALVVGKHITERDSKIGANTETVVRMASSALLASEIQRRLRVYEETLRHIDTPPGA